MGRLGWKKFAAAAAAAAAILGSIALPAQAAPVGEAAAAIFNAAKAEAAASGEPAPSAESLSNLELFLTEIEFRGGEDPVTAYKEVLKSAISGPQQSRGVTSSIEDVADLWQEFFSEGNPQAGTTLGAVLFPFLSSNGYCEGDPMSKEGAVCAFAANGEGADVTASLGENQGASAKAGNLRKVRHLPAGSDLAKAIALGHSGRTSAGSVSSKALISDRDGDTGFGSLEYSYLGIPINARYGYIYSFRYSCGTSCRASAVGVGAINGRYLLVGSDTVFASAGVAIYCDFNCALGGAWKIIRGASSGDLISYALRKGDKRHPDLLSTPTAILAQLPECGVVPAVHSVSPLFLALNTVEYKLPFDIGVPLKFGTYNQTPPTAWARLLATNLFPRPTRLSQKIGRVGIAANDDPETFTLWVPMAFTLAHYEFSRLRAWDFNIIFGAAENAKLCGPRINGQSFLYPGPTLDFVNGNQIWYWSAKPSGVADYGLPWMTVMFGFRGTNADDTDQ